MKRILTSCLLGVLLTSTVLAEQASAQVQVIFGNDRRESRQDQREWRERQRRLYEQRESRQDQREWRERQRRLYERQREQRDRFERQRGQRDWRDDHRY